MKSFNPHHPISVPQWSDQRTFAFFGNTPERRLTEADRIAEFWLWHLPEDAKQIPAQDPTNPSSPDSGNKHEPGKSYEQEDENR